jgi:hypothetical protein
LKLKRCNLIWQIWLSHTDWVIGGNVACFPYNWNFQKLFSKSTFVFPSRLPRSVSTSRLRRSRSTETK